MTISRLVTPVPTHASLLSNISPCSFENPITYTNDRINTTIKMSMQFWVVWHMTFIHVKWYTINMVLLFYVFLSPLENFEDYPPGDLFTSWYMMYQLLFGSLKKYRSDFDIQEVPRLNHVRNNNSSWTLTTWKQKWVVGVSTVLPVATGYCHWRRFLSYNSLCLFPGVCSPQITPKHLKIE